MKRLTFAFPIPCRRGPLRNRAENLVTIGSPEPWTSRSEVPELSSAAIVRWHHPSQHATLKARHRCRSKRSFNEFLCEYSFLVAIDVSFRYIPPNAAPSPIHSLTSVTNRAKVSYEFRIGRAILSMPGLELCRAPHRLINSAPDLVKFIPVTGQGRSTVCRPRVFWDPRLLI